VSPWNGHETIKWKQHLNVKQWKERKPPISIIETLESAIFWIRFCENEFIKLLSEEKESGEEKKSAERNHLIIKYLKMDQ
jgi:hypothetical protein